MSIFSFLRNSVDSFHNGPNWRQKADFLARQQLSEIDEQQAQVDYRKALTASNNYERARKVVGDLAAGAQFKPKFEQTETPYEGLEPVRPGFLTGKPTVMTPQHAGEDVDIGSAGEVEAASLAAKLEPDDLRGRVERVARNNRETAQRKHANEDSLIDRRTAQTAAETRRLGQGDKRIEQGAERLRISLRNQINGLNKPIILSDDQGQAIAVYRDGRQRALGVRKNPPSVGERQSRAGIEDILADISEIEDIVANNPDAVGIGSTMETTARRYGTQLTGGAIDPPDPDMVDIQARLASGLVSQLKSISGVAVSDREAERFRKTIPDSNMPHAMFIQRLGLWREDLLRSHRAFIASGSGSMGRGTGGGFGAGAGGGRERTPAAPAAAPTGGKRRRLINVTE